MRAARAASLGDITGGCGAEPQGAACATAAANWKARIAASYTACSAASRRFIFLTTRLEDGVDVRWVPRVFHPFLLKPEVGWEEE